MHHPPLISIIVPIRNEARYISRCLDSLLAQDYPAEQIEIWVVDGRSDDGTREQVLAYAARDARIQLVDNPEQTAPYAMNYGLDQVRGEVVVRVDGHCTLASNYLSRAVALLEETGYACVGGPLTSVGESPWAQAIALAMSSPFGVGNARFRYSQTAGEVDTLAFGAYRREVLDAVGRFNPALTRNQDDEYNYRLRAAGHRLYLSPELQSVYYTRSNLTSLWRQYFQYGYWKIRVLRDHPGSVQARHLIPAAFVATLVGGIGAAVGGGRKGRLALASFLGLYGSAALVFGLKRTAQQRRYLPGVLAAFPVLHLAYGCGFWRGLWALVRQRGTRHER
ncbi:MAG: glycosyltransferase family 2 protein [Candidatus Sericytochromatia bacterium]